MIRVVCSYCGLPFRARRTDPGGPSFCCSGCALASRLPRVDERGEFPVTPALVVALIGAFVLFNQALFWGLGVALARDSRPELAQIFGRISLGVGALAWAIAAAGTVFSPARRWTDAAALLAAGAAVAGGWWAPWGPAGAAAGNAALALWLARGWGRRRFTKKRELTI